MRIKTCVHARDAKVETTQNLAKVVQGVLRYGLSSLRLEPRGNAVPLLPALEYSSSNEVTASAAFSPEECTIYTRYLRVFPAFSQVQGEIVHQTVVKEKIRDVTAGTARRYCFWQSTHKNEFIHYSAFILSPHVVMHTCANDISLVIRLATRAIIINHVKHNINLNFILIRFQTLKSYK